MVRHMKGRSSKKIQEEFPQLGRRYWGKHFWGIGYAAFSSGHVTDAMIEEYLKHHDKHANHNDDDFVVE
jgi:putative transposase